MKVIKKISLLLIVMMVAFFATGCGSKNIEGSLESLMDKVYKDLPKDQTPMMLENHEITEDNIEYYLGSPDIEYEEALASESGIGSIAHSVVLVRVKDDADIEKVKDTIKEKVDPRKWICVGVEREDLIVKNKGNLIILIIEENEDSRKILEKGFDSLK